MLYIKHIKSQSIPCQAVRLALVIKSSMLRPHIRKAPDMRKERLTMNDGFEFLFEKEEMFARMIMQVLEDNGIPCVESPVYGAALASKTGRREWLKVYVPAEKLPEASELLEAFFSAACIDEENEVESEYEEEGYDP